MQKYSVTFKYNLICHGKDKSFLYNVSFKTHSSYIPMANIVNSSNYCKCFNDWRQVAAPTFWVVRPQSRSGHSERM